MATWRPAKQRGKFYVRASFGSGKNQRRPTATLSGTFKGERVTTRTIDRLAELWEADERAKWLDELKHQSDDDEPAPSAPTLSSVWAELIVEASASWSPGHRDRHETIRFDCDVRDLGDGRALGTIPLDELARRDVSLYLNNYAETPVRRDGTLPTRLAIVGRLKAIRTAINYAIDTGRLSADPTRKMIVPKGRFVEERDLPDLAELEATLRRACSKLPPSKRYLDRGDRAVFLPQLVTMAIWSGMRREEILGLRFRDVTFLEDGWSVVKVRRAVTAAPAGEGGYRIGDTKNERRRELPLSPAATQVIGARRLALEIELAENDVRRDVEDAFVFSASWGEHPLRPLSVRSWWDSLRQVEPELDRIKFKDLRAAHSRKMNRVVGHRGTVAAHMGHGEDVNRQHYDGRQAGDFDTVRGAIEGLLDD